MDVLKLLGNKYRKALGDKPTLKVIYRYALDRTDSRRRVRLMRAEQEKLWGHDGEIRLVHATLYCVANAGDHALSECIRVLFERFLGPVNWRLVSLFKAVDEDYLKEVNGADGLVVGGHGAFLPDTNKNDISGWEWPCGEREYLGIEVPLIVFAVGYNFFPGQERSRLFERNVNALAARSDFFGLRNHGSVREVESFLEDRARGPVFQPCPTMLTRYLFPELPEKKETRRIAVNVALDRAEKRMGQSEELILSQIARAMRLISERGYEIHFVTHCDMEIRFIKYLDREKCRYSYHHATMWSTKKLVGFYNEMDMVIGMRGHGIWIPFGVNCHVLALGNQNKTKWFFEDIGAPEWNLDITAEPNRLAELILDRFIDIHEKNGEETTRRLLAAQESFWETTKSNMEAICGAVREYHTKKLGVTPVSVVK